MVRGRLVLGVISVGIWLVPVLLLMGVWVVVVTAGLVVAIVLLTLRGVPLPTPRPVVVVCLWKLDVQIGGVGEAGIHTPGHTTVLEL